MNDAHIYCSEEQFEQEFMGVIDLYKKYFDLFGIDKYVMRLSLHSKAGLGKKYVDNERLWIKTEDMVRRAMDNGGVPYVEVQTKPPSTAPRSTCRSGRHRTRVHAGDEPGGLCRARTLRPEVRRTRKARTRFRCASTARRSPRTSA
jgi:hypothetical protein